MTVPIPMLSAGRGVAPRPVAVMFPWRFFPMGEFLRLEASSTATAATTTSVHPASPSTTASARGVLLALSFWLGRVIDKQSIEGECVGKYEVSAHALGNKDQQDKQLNAPDRVPS